MLRWITKTYFPSILFSNIKNTNETNYLQTKQECNSNISESIKYNLKRIYKYTYTYFFSMNIFTVIIIFYLKIRQ